jgi:DNA-binding NtrC family response regulator
MGKSNEKEKILVVDDAANTREILQRKLSKKGFVVFTASSVQNGINILQNTHIDLVITDFKMPKVSGMDLVKHVRENYKHSEVIMITGYPSVGSAVEAVKIGAEDYLAKPFTDEELFTAVNKALEKLRSRRQMQKVVKTDFADQFGIIGRSESIQKVLRDVEKASKTPSTVLIYGESGTGKELIARAIHYNGIRSSAPFVPINCSSIPETLLESELFGHVRGAFTGANETRDGFFQTAEGGTIFLDEISDTSASMQAKLLRVLQEKEVYKIGTSQPKKVDVRILAATNKQLSQLVEKGRFRKDLYYRLNVIRINIPPLRERQEDILLLINHFTQKYSDQFDKPIPEFTHKTIEVLKNYQWPGNVRELENEIHRIIVMNEGETVDVPDLPDFMRFTATGASGLNRSLEDVEAEHIRNVYENVEENKSKASRILGISRKTLRDKLKKYGIEQ